MIHDNLLVPKLEMQTENPYYLHQNQSIEVCNEADEADQLNDSKYSQMSQESCVGLYGLNSDNLIKFSQQSEIADLCLREMSNKKKNEVLPILEEHDNGGSEFKIILNAEKKVKGNWFYSEKANKIYIKPNDIMNLEVAFKSSLACEKLHIRAMIVFVKEVSHPVLRCLNHSSKDPALKEKIKQSLLRCENSNVKYVGTIEGKNINDRLSVWIPLGEISSDKQLKKQTIALQFTCQNSCIGRQETSVIFYLENMNEDILAQRFINVKVCSCPKRDMAQEEKYLGGQPRKRGHKDDSPIPKKYFKTGIKKDNMENIPNITQSANGNYQIEMEFPDIESARHSVKCAFNELYVKKQRSTIARENYDVAFQKMEILLEAVQRIS